MMIIKVAIYSLKFIIARLSTESDTTTTTTLITSAPTGLQCLNCGEGEGYCEIDENGSSIGCEEHLECVEKSCSWDATKPCCQKTLQTSSSEPLPRRKRDTNGKDEVGFGSPSLRKKIGRVRDKDERVYQVICEGPCHEVTAKVTSSGWWGGDPDLYAREDGPPEM